MYCIKHLLVITQKLIKSQIKYMMNQDKYVCCLGNISYYLHIRTCAFRSTQRIINVWFKQCGTHLKLNNQYSRNKIIFLTFSSHFFLCFLSQLFGVGHPLSSTSNLSFAYFSCTIYTSNFHIILFFTFNRSII